MNRSSVISKFSLFLFTVSNNYVLVQFLIMPLIFRQVGNSFIIYILLMLALSFIINLILNNKKLKTNMLNKSINNKLVRFSLIIYFIIKIVLIATISSIVLSIGFYQNTKIIYFLVPLIIAGVYISKIRDVGVVNISTILILLSWPILFLSYFLHNNLKDFSLLLPLNFSITGVKWYHSFLFLYLILDNYTFLLTNDNAKEKSGKSLILLTNICMFFIILLNWVNLTTFVGDIFLRDYKLLGFMGYAIHSTYKYLGNLDFLYVYMITVYAILRIGFMSNYFRVLCKFKNTSKSNILIIIIILALALIFLNYHILIEKYLEYFIYLLLVLILPYFLMLVFMKKKEVK